LYSTEKLLLPLCPIPHLPFSHLSAEISLVEAMNNLLVTKSSGSFFHPFSIHLSLAFEMEMDRSLLLKTLPSLAFHDTSLFTPGDTSLFAYSSFCVKLDQNSGVANMTMLMQEGGGGKEKETH
jgi:hypothetical protein